MSNRIEALRKALPGRPNDPFLLYALAVEYAQENRSVEAEEFFRQVREQHPSYVPTYLQYGLLLQREGRVEEAKVVFEHGIVVARQAGDDHAASELGSALAVL